MHPMTAITSKPDTPARWRRREPRARRYRDDALPGLRERFRSYGPQTSLLDDLSAGGMETSPCRTGGTARRQARHRLCLPELRCEVLRSTTLRGLQLVVPAARPRRPVPVLQRGNCCDRTARARALPHRVKREGEPKEVKARATAGGRYSHRIA